jgi:ABC-type transport system substrate-binding protein
MSLSRRSTIGLLASVPWFAQAARGAGTGILKISTIGLDTSDFHRHTGSIGVVQVIAETLTSIAKDGSVVPFLAKSWTISEDGRTYRFTLQPGVKFHNGKVMTASDIVANIERIRDKVKGGWLTSTFKTVENLEAPDNVTVVLRLTQAFAPLLNLLSEMWVVSPDSPGWNDSVTLPICTGPFTFANWQPQVKLEAPAFAEYWMDGRPKVAGLHFDLSDLADASLALRAGDFHIASIPVNKENTVKNDPKTEVVYRFDTGWWFWSFNNRKPKPPFDDLRVREAIAHSMDKAALARIAGGTSAVVTNQMVAPGNLYFNEAMHKADRFIKPDLARARALLAEAKVDPAKVTIRAISSEGDIFVGPSLQMIRALGFQIDHRAYDDLGYQRALSAYEWDFFPSSSGPRADVYLRYVRLMSDGPNPGLWGGIQDPELDRLVREAVASPDIAARRSKYDAAMQRVLDHGYFYAICHARGAYGVRREVKSFVPGFTYSLHGPDYGVAAASIG